MSSSPCPPDALPYMGRVRGLANAYMSAGHNWCAPPRLHSRTQQPPMQSVKRQATSTMRSAQTLVVTDCLYASPCLSFCVPVPPLLPSWGILWAPVSGKAMSELILDGKSSCVDLTAFDPCRFAPKVQGGRGRKKGSESVGEQW